MRATMMYGAGDVRVENVPDPVLQQPTDALVRIVRSCICGSDLHPFHNKTPSEQGSPMGHEFIGVVEEMGSDVTLLKTGDVHAGIDDAYHAKYDRYGPAIVGTVVGEQVVTTTLRLVPQPA